MVPTDIVGSGQAPCNVKGKAHAPEARMLSRAPENAAQAPLVCVVCVMPCGVRRYKLQEMGKTHTKVRNQISPVGKFGVGPGRESEVDGCLAQGSL